MTPFLIAQRSKLLWVAGLLSSGCLRPPIGDDHEDGSGGVESSGLGSSASGRLDEDDSSDASALDEGSGDTTPEPACHASYVPCLPVVDDLDCPEVVDLGAAPVTIVGPDDYGLDSDADGIGCEP